METPLGSEFGRPTHRQSDAAPNYNLDVLKYAYADLRNSIWKETLTIVTVGINYGRIDKGGIIHYNNKIIICIFMTSNSL